MLEISFWGLWMLYLTIKLFMLFVVLLINVYLLIACFN